MAQRLRAPTVTVAIALALVAFAAALIAARVSPNGVEWLWNADMPKIDYPLASFYHDALRAGRLPLWNDQLGLGFPLYAEGQIGAFYPPSWLLFRLPPLVALDATRVAHLTLAGVGAGLLVLRLSGSRPGALIAALVAVLGGAITAKLEWTNLVVAYGWAPWVLLPLVRRPAPTRAGLVAAGILYGVQALAGHPNTWLLTGVAAIAILVARPPRLAGLGRAAVVLVLGGAVGAVQLLPTALLTSLSVRSTALSANDLFASAATPFDPLLFAFQGTFARLVDGHWDLYATWYPDGLFALLEAAAYVGLPVLALAAAGLGARRARPLVVAAVVLLAIPVVAAFRPGFVADIPVLNGLRSPVRAYLVVTLLLGVLAGIALARRIEGLPLGLAIIALLVPVGLYGLTYALAGLAPDTFNAIVLAATTFGSAEDVAGRRQLALDTLSAPWPLVVDVLAGAAMLALLVVVALRPRLRAPAATLAVVIVAVPLLLFGPAPNDTRPVTDFSYAQTAFLRAVADARPSRFVTIDPPGYYAGWPDQPAAAGIADLRMFSSLNLRASDEVTSLAARDTPAAARLREALGVDVVVTFNGLCPGREVAAVESEHATICRDDAALRPPWWVPSSVASPDQAGGSPIRPVEATLDVEAALAGAVEQVPEWRGTTGLGVPVDAPADGWLWVDRAWWPGWITTVDGRRVDTLRALGGQLVPVAAGSHRVAMSLVPWDALLGLAVGLVAVALALAWASRDPRRAARRAVDAAGAPVSPSARRRS